MACQWQATTFGYYDDRAGWISGISIAIASAKLFKDIDQVVDIDMRQNVERVKVQRVRVKMFRVIHAPLQDCVVCFCPSVEAFNSAKVSQHNVFRRTGF